MKKYHMLAALSAAFLLTLSFSTIAYAGGGEEIPEEVTETPTPEPEVTTNPFTPAGTGTVVNTATDEDGKQFYTITTPDENVFYLVIDLQRETDNVYFLNAVTEKDLLALAAKSDDTEKSETVVSTTNPESTSEVTTEPDTSAKLSSEPEQTGNTGTLLLVLAVVIIGGGAGYYFKIYRPKQEQAASADDDYNEYGNDPYGEQEDDTPPWDTDESTGEDEE